MITPTREFYLLDAASVAQQLLGAYLLHHTPHGLVGGKIVETEAYLGAKDEASHAFRGQTPRNSVMFGPPGRAYIYFTYGMHYCLNVVTAALGVAEAVLIRALEPTNGLSIMQANRGQESEFMLCNGPAKLVQALGVSAQINGHALDQEPLTIQFPEKRHLPKIMSGPRVGISRAADIPLRFWIADNPYVSVYKAHPKSRRVQN